LLNNVQFSGSIGREESENQFLLLCIIADLESLIFRVHRLIGELNIQVIANLFDLGNELDCMAEIHQSNRHVQHRIQRPINTLRVVIIIMKDRRVVEVFLKVEIDSYFSKAYIAHALLEECKGKSRL